MNHVSAETHTFVKTVSDFGDAYNYFQTEYVTSLNIYDDIVLGEYIYLIEDIKGFNKEGQFVIEVSLKGKK